MFYKNSSKAYNYTFLVTMEENALNKARWEEEHVAFETSPIVSTTLVGKEHYNDIFLLMNYF